MSDIDIALGLALKLKAHAGNQDGGGSQPGNECSCETHGCLILDVWVQNASSPKERMVKAEPVHYMSHCPSAQTHRSRSARIGYAALGLTSTGLGILGAFLPVMPTTCFLLLALWAFSKSSPKLHSWLWHHPRLGAPLRRWQEHRCIPMSAKIAAMLSMSGSLAFVIIATDLGWRGISATVAFMAVGAFFVLRAPSKPPGRPEDCTRPYAEKVATLASRTA